MMMTERGLICWRKAEGMASTTDLEHQEQVTADSKLIEWRHRVDLPRVRKIIFEHRQEMGREGEWLRIFALLEQIEDINEELYEASVSYEERKDNLMSGAMIAERIKDLLKNQEKLSREYDFLLKKGLLESHPKQRRETISPDMIERAKAYPIENFIDAQRGMALCIFHDDRNPSMLVKNNFVHCFACGKTGDVIDVYRKLHGATFPAAVRALQ